jgi:nucleoside-triphosphatase THEP1
MNAEKAGDALPAKWLQAAVLGSLWAASEIILGSFFHSLKLPLRSVILASIGVTLMVALGRRWSQNGLFWRAGLICALMKSLSPAGLILSPMVAIFAQGLLMELCVRTGGRNFLAFVCGGILAVSWNLLQYLAYHILIYGYDIVGIYQKIYTMATELLPLPKGNFWLPLWISLATHAAFGLLAAVLGFFLAAKKTGNTIPETSLNTAQVIGLQQSLKKKTPHSLFLLLLNVVLFIGFFVSLSLIKAPLNMLFALPLLLFWLIFYKGQLRMIRKPLFWLLFFVITMLSALVIDGAQSGFQGFSSRGLLTGLLMNVRAFTLITGFSVIGYELSNPFIRDFFIRKGARNFYLSMEVASKALPMVIANLPRPLLFLTKPRRVFAFLIVKTDDWLEELRVTQFPRPGVVIITGEVHSGKTSFLKKLILSLQSEGIKVGGFCSEAVFEEQERKGYDLLSADGLQRFPLSRTDQKGGVQIGSYYVSQEAMNRAMEMLLQESRSAAGPPVGPLVVDEIGPWELAGHGWARVLPPLLACRDLAMIWVVRKKIVNAAIAKWNLADPLIIDVSEQSADDALNAAVNRIKEFKDSHQY